MKSLSTRLGTLLAVVVLLVVPVSVPTAYSDAGTDPVLEWNTILRTTLRENLVNGLLQTRSAAMMHLAVFEAVNAIVGEYRPYLGTIAAPRGASPDAAAVAAAHRTLVTLYPASTMNLDAARAASLSAVPDGQAKDDGIAVGVAAADAMLALRANDGAATAAVPPYIPETGPGEWQPTPPAFPAMLFPRWGQVTTFGIEHGAQFRSPPPPDLDSPEYTRDYNEVKAVGDVNSTVRSQDKTDRARFYGFNLGTEVYGQAASQASIAQGKTLSENARIFALLNMAIADALISSMESKLVYTYWRPVTGIRAGDTDGNDRTAPDPNWLSLVVTPPYPAYPSNYASIAFAAHTVLKKAYGNRDHTITLTSGSAAVDVTLDYTRFSQLRDDIYDARIYGGIHYRFDMKAGARMGDHVGSYILRNQLRPVHGQD